VGIVLQVIIVHRLTESDFNISEFQDGGHDVMSHRKVLCCHLPSENEASVARKCSTSRQFLIYSTWVQHVSIFKQSTFT